MVESELLEACARGELPESERQRVLAVLAGSPAGRARLALARGLARVADGELETVVTSPRPPAPPAPGWRRAAWSGWGVRAAALAASLALALAAWLWMGPHGPAGSALAPAAFEISLENQRSAEATQQVQVQPGTGLVELGLVLDPAWSYRSYRAALHDAADRIVASADGLVPVRRPAGPEIVLTLPAADLPPGRYEVAVQGRRERGPAEDVAFQEIVVTR